VPFQHASDRILKAMNRPVATAKTLERICAWRATVPDLTIRSTFIVGFPGETDADFELLLQWLEEAELDRVGCFRYEAVAGAPANDLPGAIPEEIKEERWHRFMAAQQAISAKRLQRKVARQIRVIIDEVADGKAIGRSEGDAPEIDGKVLVSGDGFNVGDIVTVTVQQAGPYDLWARPVA
jgi:ribosomal protein S12 methylthiotransferase